MQILCSESTIIFNWLLLLIEIAFENNKMEIKWKCLISNEIYMAYLYQNCLSKAIAILLCNFLD